MIEEHQELFDMNTYGDLYLSVYAEKSNMYEPFGVDITNNNLNKIIEIPSEHHVCGTSGCIGGFIDMFYETSYNVNTFDRDELRSSFLGLTSNQATMLFFESKLWDKNAHYLGLQLEELWMYDTPKVPLKSIKVEHALKMLKGILSGHITVPSI